MLERLAAVAIARVRCHGRRPRLGGTLRRARACIQEGGGDRRIGGSQRVARLAVLCGEVSVVGGPGCELACVFDEVTWLCPVPSEALHTLS